MIPANFHITLVFVGAVAAEARQALEDAAARIAARSFVLTLDHFGYWRKPQIFMGG